MYLDGEAKIASTTREETLKKHPGYDGSVPTTNHALSRELHLYSYFNILLKIYGVKRAN